MSAALERRPILLADAQRIARELITLLSPACDRIEIAGSIRRGKPQVKDIELVLIGKPLSQLDLFGGSVQSGTVLDVLADDLLASGRFTQRLDVNGIGRWGYGARYAWYDGVAVDLFGSEAQRWGVTLMVRTGPASWNQRWVTQRHQGGAIMPYGMRLQDGWLWDGGRRIDAPEERDVFRALAIPMIPPEQRQ